jgi:DNA (cytosine-5)-methyltransferase 1
MKPRLLDLFSGVGGAAMGYHRAGFEVVGVDIKPQPNYPFEFHQADAMTYPLDGFDAIHASPPCQAFSQAQRIRGREHPELVVDTRARLVATDVPYVIENVVGAPLLDPLMLCGTAFALPMMRHRLFESNVWMMAPACAHGRLERFWHRGKWIRSVAPFGHEFPADLSREVMGIDWMTRDEVSLAIPPVFTEHIGAFLMAEIDARRMERAA